MAAIPNLSSSPLNLLAIREQEKKRFLDLLSGIQGDKCAVLDPQLSRPLFLVTEDVSLLKKCGVKQFLYVTGSITTIAEPNVLFFIKPCPAHIDLVANHIAKIKEQEAAVNFYILFFPNISKLTRELVKDKGLSNLVTCLDTNMDIYPLDDDILSLEINSCFSELYLANNLTSLQLTANALMRMQQLYGVIPNVTAVGPHSQAVVDMLLQMRLEGCVSDVNLPPEIDRLIVIDRALDYPTSFVVPLTYEGLLDEVIGIDCGVVSITEKASDKKSDKPVTVRLNNSDSFFRELRDDNIIQVVTEMTKKAKLVQDESDSRPTNASSTLNDIIEFKRKLPEIIERRRLLGCHFNLVSTVTAVSNGSEFRKRWEEENLIISGGGSPQEIIGMGDEGAPFTTVMRLLIIYSIVNNGIKAKVIDEIRKDIIQLYGFDKMLLLHNLEKLNLLISREINGNFSTIRSRMRLLKEGVNGLDMTDMSYVCSGYSPMSGRLIQAMLTQPILSAEIVKLLPVSLKDYSQPIQCKQRDGGMKKKIALITFIGGITYTEIAAIRQLKNLEDFGYEVIILTTNTTNGIKLLKELSDPLPLIPVSVK